MRHDDRASPREQRDDVAWTEEHVIARLSQWKDDMLPYGRREPRPQRLDVDRLVKVQSGRERGRCVDDDLGKRVRPVGPIPQHVFDVSPHAESFRHEAEPVEAKSHDVG